MSPHRLVKDGVVVRSISTYIIYARFSRCRTRFSSKLRLVTYVQSYRYVGPRYQVASSLAGPSLRPKDPDYVLSDSCPWLPESRGYSIGLVYYRADKWRLVVLVPGEVTGLMKRIIAEEVAEALEGADAIVEVRRRLAPEAQTQVQQACVS